MLILLKLSSVTIIPIYVCVFEIFHNTMFLRIKQNGKNEKKNIFSNTNGTKLYTIKAFHWINST